jgi:hypothetical protein
LQHELRLKEAFYRRAANVKIKMLISVVSRSRMLPRSLTLIVFTLAAVLLRPQRISAQDNLLVIDGRATLEPWNSLICSRPDTRSGKFFAGYSGAELNLQFSIGLKASHTPITGKGSWHIWNFVGTTTAAYLMDGKFQGSGQTYSESDRTFTIVGVVTYLGLCDATSPAASMPVLINIHGQCPASGAPALSNIQVELVDARGLVATGAFPSTKVVCRMGQNSNAINDYLDHH